MAASPHTPHTDADTVMPPVAASHDTHAHLHNCSVSCCTEQQSALPKPDTPQKALRLWLPCGRLLLRLLAAAQRPAHRAAIAWRPGPWHKAAGRTVTQVGMVLRQACSAATALLSARACSKLIATMRCLTTGRQRGNPDFCSRAACRAVPPSRHSHGSARPDVAASVATLGQLMPETIPMQPGVRQKQREQQLEKQLARKEQPRAIDGERSMRSKGACLVVAPCTPCV